MRNHGRARRSVLMSTLSTRAASVCLICSGLPSLRAVPALRASPSNSCRLGGTGPVRAHTHLELIAVDGRLGATIGWLGELGRRWPRA
jgi:hypothetical protein